MHLYVDNRTPNDCYHIFPLHVGLCTCNAINIMLCIITISMEYITSLVYNLDQPPSLHQHLTFQFSSTSLFVVWFPPYGIICLTSSNMLRICCRVHKNSLLVPYMPQVFNLFFWTQPLSVQY